MRVDTLKEMLSRLPEDLDLTFVVGIGGIDESRLRKIFPVGIMDGNKFLFDSVFDWDARFRKVTEGSDD